MLALARPARAVEKGAPRLVFSAPAGCPPEATFRDAVAIFFEGFDPFDPNAPDAVHVTFTKIPGGFRGSVQYVPAKGDPWPAQEKTGAPCAAIYQSVARLASMRIPDPPPKSAPPAASETPPAPAEPPPKPPDPVVSTTTGAFVPPPNREPQFKPFPPSLPEPPMDVAINLYAYGLMTVGLTANVGPGVGLGASVRGEIFSLGLEARGVFPATIVAHDAFAPKSTVTSIPVSYDASQWSALLVPCARWRYLVGCGVFQGGVLITDAALRVPKRTHLFGDVALGPRLGFEVPFAERFAVFGFGEAMFSLLPTGEGDVFDNINVVWERPRVTGFFSVGLAVAFK